MSNQKARTLGWGALLAPASVAPTPNREIKSKSATMIGRAQFARPVTAGPVSEAPAQPVGAEAATATPPTRPNKGTIELDRDHRAAPLTEPSSIGSHDTLQADTMAAPVFLPFAAGLNTPVSIATAMRTTVLPRLEHVDDTPTLVQEGKARYEEQRKLGEGGMGEVLHALDNDIRRPVAVKRLRSDISSPSALARFVDEIRTVGRLEHPNIIPIHDVGVDGPGQYYFVMKYVDGLTLESIIEGLAAGDRALHARFGFEARVQIFRGILEAVAFAHSKGILHRDIKPANVMVGAHGEVILMDWGIAKDLTSSARMLPTHEGEHVSVKEGRRGRAFETQVGALVGTPAYMSPEQARGEPLDAQSDVYSLSVLFHEFLTLNHYLDGKTTLEGVISGATTDEVPAAMSTTSPHQPRVPFDLSWFVRAGTAKDPSKRYRSVQAMLDRLDRRAQGEIPIECPVTLVKSVNGQWARFVDRYPFQVVAVLACVILGMLAATVFEVRMHV